MKENDIIAGNYRILKEIGRGGTGTVFLGYHMHLRKYVVLKEMRLSIGDEGVIRRETDILKNLHHMYLPQVYDFLIDGPNVITVLDYVEGNDLSRYTPGPEYLSEEILLKWLEQMAEVLAYLHSNQVPVIHSDIKPGNVIIKPNGDICLIDFNISLLVNDKVRVSGYSEQYASPEQFYLAQSVSSGMNPGFELRPDTDIYSTGALFYYLMTGIAPNCVSPARPLSEMGDIGYSPALVKIIDRCMQWNRDQRYRDGNELLKAVRNYYKQTTRYKVMLAMRILCILLGAAAIGGGISGFLRWRANTIREEYQEEYADVARRIQEGDEFGAEDAGLSILNNERYGSYLRKSPEDHAQLLHAMGDIFYNRGDYNTALDYYRKALDTAIEAGTDLTVYYRDCAIALARLDRLSEAKAMLEDARSKGTADTALKLIEITCAFMEGDYASCTAIAQEIENDPDSDRDSISRAESIAGQACGKTGDYESQIEWLEKAAQGGNVLYRRMLGDAYWQMTGVERLTDTQKQLYAIKAREVYQELCDNYYQTYENLLNLAIIEYYLRDYTECQISLERCMEKYPEKYREDYHLSMYKAFLYDETGRKDDARTEARYALEIIERTGVSSIDNSETQAVYRLQSISR